MRSIIALLTALCALAAPPAVRREGPFFRISGVSNESEVSVYVGEGDVPPVLGTFTMNGADLLFRPRYELEKTVASRVVVQGREFRFPAEMQALPRTTVVEKVYPSGPEIPANQLKFYIHFSAPMHPGEAWENLKLLDHKGKVVELAFIEIDQELWDREARRLTVLFDPGRIKRGVLPREEIGAALEPGATYTLVASPVWRDARRVPIRAEFRHTFKVVPEDRTPIDPAKWRITSPAAGTREPLVIDFGEPLDAALALRLITVPTTPGSAELANAERQWRYTPESPWPATRQTIQIDTALEDLAGNKVGRPFDIDTFDRVTVRTNRGQVTLSFQPR